MLATPVTTTGRAKARLNASKVHFESLLNESVSRASAHEDGSWASTQAARSGLFIIESNRNAVASSLERGASEYEASCCSGVLSSMVLIGLMGAGGAPSSGGSPSCRRLTTSVVGVST